jgi:hypothetical protein
MPGLGCQISYCVLYMDVVQAISPQHFQGLHVHVQQMIDRGNVGS